MPSRYRAKQHGRRQPKTRESASQAERQRRPQALEKEIWIRHGAKVPGNPPIDNHATEYQHVVDAYGNRICICENHLVKFEAGAAGVEQIEKIHRIQDASALWAGPLHVVLTHALRFLQQFCLPQSMDDALDRRRLRGGITPLDLLMASKMPSPQAEEILKVLKNLDLVTLRSNAMAQCWFIHLACKGIGPQFQKYTRAELIDDWQLPVELVTAADSAAKETDGNNQDTRLARLTAVLQVLRSAALAADAPLTDDGWLEFVPEPSALQQIMAGASLTRSNALDCFTTLRHAELLQRVTRGPRPSLIRLRDVETVTNADLERVRKARTRRNTQKSVAARRGLPEDNEMVARLNAGYQALLSMVPKDVQADDATRVVEFVTEHTPVHSLLQERLGLSKSQASRLLVDLRELGIYHFERLFELGIIRSRHSLLIGHREFTKRDLARLRKKRSKTSRAKAPATSAAVTPSTTVSQELAEVLQAAYERIDQQDDQITELKRSLKQYQATIKELEKKLAASTANVPAEVGTHIARLRARLNK